MPYASQTASYRELEVLSASPERLVVLLFDHLVVQLERARMMTERDNLPEQVAALGRARNIVAELLSTLDFERGGSIADELAALYQYLLYELVDVGQRRDVALMGRLTGIARTLRDGFAGAAEQLQAQKLSA
jgi:flagellar protein FliS